MKPRGGFSLLEVILAIAILGLSVAILGEGLRQALSTARRARDTTKAGMLCESKLNEVLAGIQDTTSQTSGTFDDQTEPGELPWNWSITTEPAQQAGLLSLRVTVRQDPPANQPAVEVSLVRWMIDPQTLSTTQSSTTQSSSGASQ